MACTIPELVQIAEDLRQGRTATPQTIRTFVSWFGIQRRTPAHVEYINDELTKCGLRTVPGYTDIWIDTPIAFELAAEHKIEVVLEAIDKELSTSLDDPSFSIAKIASANHVPVSVNPNASLSNAMTIMLARNFSQLPVMTSPYEVKGVISWRSIGTRTAISHNGSDVRAYMDEAYELPKSASLFSAISVIADHDYVLVRAPDRKIAGIVTASDIALQFEDSTTPFLLISEIERNLRAVISPSLSIEDIRATCSPEHLPKDFAKISDLSFGNLVKILEHPNNWAKVGISLDRQAFCSELAYINVIRNEVMHFDTDPIEDSVVKLRNMSQMFATLRRLKAL